MGNYMEELSLDEGSRTYMREHPRLTPAALVGRVPGPPIAVYSHDVKLNGHLTFGSFNTLGAKYWVKGFLLGNILVRHILIS